MYIIIKCVSHIMHENCHIIYRTMGNECSVVVLLIQQKCSLTESQHLHKNNSLKYTINLSQLMYRLFSFQNCACFLPTQDVIQTVCCSVHHKHPGSTSSVYELLNVKFEFFRKPQFCY